MQTTKWLTILNRWGPVLLVMAAIFAFSALPGEQAEAVLVGLVGTTESAPIESLPAVVIDWYKAGHVIGYGLLGAAAARALVLSGRAGFWPALLICAAYAVTDEIHQGFVPNRHAWTVDVLIDAGAAAVAIGLYLFFHKK
ncbi:MAG: VanZ family protein [Chloroflexi bacterium]|nr:VanZ family protein [Chloroflexota bacterium]